MHGAAENRHVHFSALATEWGDLTPSPLAETVSLRRAKNLPITDLITANPQEHGLEFPADKLAVIISRATSKSRFYRPDPRGQLAAREAVAEYHQGISPHQVILTPGTSLAYYYAFRLLAQPGDEILCPSPSYPLFDDLAQLAGLKVRYYHLQQVRGSSHWHISPEEIAFQLTSRTRALVLVSPHNPTGSIASASELEAVAELCRRFGVPVIFDEVFRECVHGSIPVHRPFKFGAPLTITLNGVSKMLSLPGLKAGWMVIEGDKALCDPLLAATEYVSDLFLPVSEITQFSLPALLGAEGLASRRNIASEYRRRMHDLVQQFHSLGMGGVFPPEGSPYLCIPLPPSCDWQEEPLVLRLLESHGILLHPGHLYRMPSPALVSTCVHSEPWPLKLICSEIHRFEFG